MRRAESGKRHWRRRCVCRPHCHESRASRRGHDSPGDHAAFLGVDPERIQASRQPWSKTSPGIVAHRAREDPRIVTRYTPVSRDRQPVESGARQVCGHATRWHGSGPLVRSRQRSSGTTVGNGSRVRRGVVKRSCRSLDSSTRSRRPEVHRGFAGGEDRSRREGKHFGLPKRRATIPRARGAPFTALQASLAMDREP